MRILSSLSPASALAALFACALAASTSAAESIPFVGCPSDGQQGPVAAPKGQAKALNLDPAAAKGLAWYQAQYSAGALAPRGWKCFSFYGSSGVTLTIAPSGKLDDPSQPIAGPAVTLIDDIGGTSGRFDVAKIAARVFADPERAFVASVIAEGIEPKENFPAGPYPADKLTYKTPTLVEFATPAGKDGLGTAGRLAKGALPVAGLAKLVGPADGPDLYLLAVRLPAAQADLAASIVGAAEATLPNSSQ
ncbi:MAG: hypothetical protein ABSF67_00890 [Roseiarcus sp.]|jgi:hypothetical protein